MDSSLLTEKNVADFKFDFHDVINPVRIDHLEAYVKCRRNLGLEDDIVIQTLIDAMNSQGLQGLYLRQASGAGDFIHIEYIIDFINSGRIQKGIDKNDVIDLQEMICENKKNEKPI
jgi:hypothetical protein